MNKEHEKWRRMMKRKRMIKNIKGTKDDQNIEGMKVMMKKEKLMIKNDENYCNK